MLRRLGNLLFGGTPGGGAQCADATSELPPGPTDGEPLMVKGRTLRQVASEGARPFPLSIQVPDYDGDQRPLGQYMSTVNCAMVLRSASHYSGRDLSPIPGSRDGSMHKKDRWDAAAPVSVFPSELTTSAELSEVSGESSLSSK